MSNEIDPINTTVIIPQQQIESFIYIIRGVPVMLDRDLAMLYKVETKHLNRQVKRNPSRFPEDFMFQLSKEEWDGIKNNWRCQNVTSNSNDEFAQWVKMGVRRMPYAFTEEGVGQLSAVLKSETAALISVRIQRAFVAMRRYITANAGLFQRIESLEAYRLETKQEFKAIGERFDQIMDRLDDGSLRQKLGIFFDGQMFDAFVLIETLFKRATRRIILIDDYVNADILQRMRVRASLSITIDCYVQSRHQTRDMQLAFSSYNAQYPSVHVQLHTFERSHDRFLIIDDEVYHFGASIKDLGKRWFGVNLITEYTADDLIARL